MTTNEDLIFVELAIKKELVTQEQVDEILALQRKLAGMGLEESAADLLVKKGMLSEEDARALQVKVSPKGGRQQIEGYRLVERLGRGGMGSVYKAIQLSMNRPVALKVLKPSLTKDDSSTARLRREAQLVGKLKHPNIVQGLDFGVSNNFHYFAMEYVDGESVKEILASRGPFKEREALRIVKQVALALDHAHGEGVVHRDVKPGNILVGKDGAVKLADYGLAKGPLEDAELTQSGVTVGTPQYISPEQAQGPSEVDIRTDLYSLGATLYHMVTGRPPYEGETLAHLIQQVLYEPYAPPRSLRRDLSPEVAFLVEKLMARKPRHRYQTPKELLRDIEAIETGRSIVPSGWQGDFEAFFLRRRLRRLVAATVAVFVLGGLATGFLVWRLDQIRKAAAEAAALRAYEQWAHTAATEGGLDEHIRYYERIPEEYPGTEGARLAGKMLNRLYGEREERLGNNPVVGEATELARKGEWGEALLALSRRQEGLEKKENASLARDHLQAVIGELTRQRDDAVPDVWRKFVRSLVGKPPEEAYEALSRYRDDLRVRGFVIGESEEPLGEANELLRNFGRAIEGTIGYLNGPEALLSADSRAKDYEAIQEELRKAQRAFEADAGLQQVLETLEPAWAANLRSRFPELAQKILAANDAESGKALARVADYEKEHRYEQALALLDELIARSVPDIAATLNPIRDNLAVQLESNRKLLNESWGAFLPRFLDLLGRRHWSAARQELARLSELSRILLPNPVADELLPAADSLLIFSQEVEARFVERVDGASSLEGLWFGTMRMAPVKSLRVEGRNLHFVYGAPQVRPLAEIGVEDLFRYAEVGLGQPLPDLSHAVLWLGELERSGIPRRLMKALPEIEREVLEARDSPILEAFVDEVLSLVRMKAALAAEALRELEDLAAETFEKARSALDEGRYQDAVDGFSRLLETEALSETEFVKQRRTTIQDLRAEAKRKLPTVDLGSFFGTRVEHLAGDTVKQGYRAALDFDLEDEEQLSRMKFTEGRIGIIEIEKLPLGPNPPGADPDQERIEVQHLLWFRPPESVPDDWLNHHPLRIESPFLYSREMSIRFKARWERPLALLVSLCGTNVLVLSDDGRRENGRGVYVWQSTELSQLDRVVPEELRKTWLMRHPEALAGEAANGRYFQFEPDRWYGIRFVKGEKFAALYVDERLVFEQEIRRYGAKGEEIVVLTYTPMKLDEMRIEGTVDPDWYRSRTMRAAREARRTASEDPK